MRRRNIAQSILFSAAIGVIAPVVGFDATAAPQAPARVPAVVHSRGAAPTPVRAPVRAFARAPVRTATTAAPARPFVRAPFRTSIRAPAAAPAAVRPAPSSARPSPITVRPAPASPGDTGAGRSAQRPIISNGRNDPIGNQGGTNPELQNNAVNTQSPDPRTSPIGVRPGGLGINPINPPAGAGPLGGRGETTPPTLTGRQTIPNGGQNGISARSLNNRDHFRDRHGHRRQIVIIPDNFVPWSFYSPGVHWPYGGYSSSYSEQVNDYDNNGYRNDSAGDTAQPEAPQPAVPEVPSAVVDQAKAINALEASAEYRQALGDLAKAEEDQTLAYQKVLEQLKQNPVHQRLAADKQAAADRIQAIQATAPLPAPELLTPAAQAKLEVGAKLTRMEQEAVAADPAASAARTRLTQAQQKVLQMRQTAQINAVGG